MACNCGRTGTPAAPPLTLRCIDPAGCSFYPLGERACGEVYNDVNACTAALFLETWPTRLEIVTPEATPAQHKEK